MVTVVYGGRGRGARRPLVARAPPLAPVTSFVSTQRRCEVWLCDGCLMRFAIKPLSCAYLFVTAAERPTSPRTCLPQRTGHHHPITAQCKRGGVRNQVAFVRHRVLITPPWITLSDESLTPWCHGGGARQGHHPRDTETGTHSRISSWQASSQRAVLGSRTLRLVKCIIRLS